MNELAHWMADVADCIYCGKPCGPDDWDNDGNPIHPECVIDREGARIDAVHDSLRDREMMK